MNYVLRPGYHFAACNTLEEALELWRDKYALFEPAGTVPAPCLTAPKYIDNGYLPEGFYTHRAKYIPVRYQVTKHRKMQYTTLVFAQEKEALPCDHEGNLL